MIKYSSDIILKQNEREIQTLYENYNKAMHNYLCDQWLKLIDILRTIEYKKYICIDFSVSSTNYSWKESQTIKQNIHQYIQKLNGDCIILNKYTYIDNINYIKYSDNQLEQLFKEMSNDDNFDIIDDDENYFSYKIFFDSENDAIAFKLSYT
jgi:hypothetical protein